MDTAGWDFQARSYGYRLRRAGDSYLATIKGLGGATGAVHTRIEHQVALSEPLPPQQWPLSSARALALRLCGSEPLIVLFEVRQTRESRPLYAGDRAVAELSLDRVSVFDPDGGGPVDSYLELEAELLSGGTEQDLDRLVSALREEWSLTPGERSKYERGLAVLSGATQEGDQDMEQAAFDSQEPLHATIGAIDLSLAFDGAEPSTNLGLEPDEPMSEAGRKVLRDQFRRILSNEAGTRLGEDIEALHDMRVATRRMRAAFRIFGSFYERATVAPYLKGLKRTRRALGPVRDLDVFRATMVAYLEGLPESQQDSMANLQAVLEVQREAARLRLTTYLDSAKYHRFVEGFAEFLDTEDMGSLPASLDEREPRPHYVRHAAPVAIYQRLATVRAYDEWVRIPDPPLIRLHSLRISCKRLRYTLEYFGEILGPNTGALVEEIVALQDHLGVLQDTVVASAILSEYLRLGTWGRGTGQPQLPKAGPPDAAGVEAYLAATRSAQQDLVDRFPEAWQRLNGPELSQMVAEAVMVL